MATYVISANTASQRISSASATAKMRIATNVAIHYAVGNSSVTASNTNEIIPANSLVDRHVGVGNYVAVIRADGTSGNVSLTEVGSAIV